MRVGRAAFVDGVAARPATPGVAEVWVAIDGRPAGVIRCSDPLRADAAAVVARVRATGARPVLLTGDASSVGAEVGEAVGIADIHGDATPAGKAEAGAGCAAKARSSSWSVTG